MPGPTVIDIAANTWVKVASGIISGQIYKILPGTHYRQTWRYIDDAAPTDPDEGDFFTAEFMPISAPAPGIDVWVYCHLKPGKIRVNNSQTVIGPDALGKDSFSVQHPLTIDGNSIYVQDIDFNNSDFTDWVGDPENLFKSPFSASITNSTGNNPKQIILAFKRTVNALQIGFGENNGGDFSNLKVSLLGSGGATRSVFDGSADDTDLTSRNAEFENELFNSLLIEFYTDDEVSLSNITIQRARYNTVQVQGIDENGDFQTARVNSDGLLLVGDFFLEVAKGNIPGHSKISKFGENNLVGSDLETVWDAGGIYPWGAWDTSGATVLQVQSTDANDTAAGTGARTVQLEGLDANFEELIETIILDGLNSVNTVGEFIRLHRMSVLTGGTFNGAIGNIIAENDGVTVAQIVNGNNQTLMGVYTVPAGKTGFVVFGKTSCGKAADSKIKFFIRMLGSVFNVQHTANIYQNSYDYPFSAVPEVPEKTDIDVRAVSTNPSGFEVTIAFDAILVEN